MLRGKEVEQEYLNMRSKVESRIKELQSRLSPNPSQNNSNSNLMSPRTCQHHCSHHHCHHHCQMPSHSHFSINVPEQVNNSVCNPSIRVLPKTQPSNDLLGQALIQSIKSQQQINDNIRVLTDKIQKLSIQQNKSHNMSEVFSESTTKKHRKTPLFKDFFLEGDKGRSHSSEVKLEYVIPSPVEEKTPIRKQIFKKIKNKKKGGENNSSSNVLSSSKRGKSKAGKSMSKDGFKSEYFLSFGCPLHSPEKISLKRLQLGEVYKDAQHRNRKHEKDHLIASFKQQQRSRKRLISRIERSLFNEYGSK